VGIILKAMIYKSRFSLTSTKTTRARTLRRNMTIAEKRLWSHLRNSQLQNLAFRRQHPVGPYVLDFYCPEIQLGIELDGGQHGFESGLVADKKRTQWLEQQGINIIRFWNNEVLQNIEGALYVLGLEIEERQKR
jgi:very-short-patch-repair endonuclease